MCCTPVFYTKLCFYFFPYIFFLIEKFALCAREWLEETQRHQILGKKKIKYIKSHSHTKKKGKFLFFSFGWEANVSRRVRSGTHNNFSFSLFFFIDSDQYIYVSMIRFLFFNLSMGFSIFSSHCSE